ncbi:MAG: hypothetical protein FOGNACKC_00771 [Anaerolineae bacterium]|nr:hypothetical protein [Anaerolineae bacterium]
MEFNGITYPTELQARYAVYLKLAGFPVVCNGALYFELSLPAVGLHRFKVWSRHREMMVPFQWETVKVFLGSVLSDYQLQKMALVEPVGVFAGYEIRRILYPEQGDVEQTVLPGFFQLHPDHDKFKAEAIVWRFL